MFSKLMKKTIAVAAIAAMTSVMAAVATPWWSIDFNSYEEGAKVSASTETQGTWTQQDDDLSVVTSQSLSLNTQGKDLLWTPNAPAESYDSVILDADVKFVASDVEPTPDNSMQTAIYLKATDDGDVLCVYQNTADGAAWEAKDAFTIADGDTKHVTITIDYSDETPMVTLTIGDTSVEYPVANVADKVSSVAFRGTGVVDNFKAQTSVNVTYVADVDGQGFNTYADALAYVAANGGNLKITGNSAEELSFGTFTFTKNATIDLGGKEITAAFVVDNGAQFSIDNGTVTAPAKNDVIYIKNGKATVGKDATLYASTDCAVFMKNLDNAEAQLALDVYGTLVGAEGFGTIQGNGSNLPASEIYIHDNATVTNEKDLAIYHPQNGTLTIDAATIVGTTAIEMRAGELVVNEGAIIEGTAEFSATPNGNGSTVLGAAIALSQHTTEQPTSVTVNGGTLKGARAFYQDNLASGTSTSVSATIAAGTTLDGAIEVAEEGFVMPEAADGSYTLATANFIVAGMPYDTFAAAYDAAAEGATIEVYTDFAASEIITIAKGITIDGNGHTLTSTASRAINIDTTGDVVIKDLTIVANGARAVNIINQASTVTLDNVTASAKNNAVMVATSAAGANLTVNDSDLTGLAVVNVAAPNAIVEINNTNITNVDANANENYGAISTFKTATGATVTVNGGKVVVADDSFAALNAIAGSSIVFNGTEGVDKVVTPVAYIGDAGFETLEEAIEYAKAGQTIVLNTDTTTDAITIAKDVTIDLNGKTITSAFVVDGGAQFSIDNGTVNALADNDVIYIKNGKATVGADATLIASTDCAVFMKNLDNANAQLALDVYGTLVGAEGFGTIQGNGSNKPASVINIYDGATVTNAADLAIYHPQNGTLTIGAATITGTTGIEMRAGNLVVNGAIIEGTAEFSATPNGNGSTVLGAAIALSQHTTEQPTSVTVNGGTLKGARAFYQDNLASGTSTSVSATIAAGTTLDGAIEVAEEGFVMPEAADGSYTLATANFIVAGMPYDTFAAAYDAAAEGATIEVYTDFAASEIITIAKGITIDGNGHTLTSTASRAINIDTTGDVVIKDLTIVANGARAVNIINQASTVTLDNVTASAKNNAVMVATSAAGANLTVNDSDLTGLAVVNVAAPNADVEINNTNITNVDANPNENYGAISTFKTATGATVVVNGGKVVVADDSAAAFNATADSSIVFNGTEGVDKVMTAAAYIGDAGYETLQEAIDDAKAGQTIILNADNAEDVAISGTTTIDLNDFDATGTFTLTDTAAELYAAQGLKVVTNVEGYEVVFADGCYSVQEKVVEVEFAAVKTTSIVIDGNTAKLTIDGEYTEVKVYFKATLDAEWEEVKADFAEGVITVPATTATGFFTVHAR